MLLRALQPSSSNQYPHSSWPSWKLATAPRVKTRRIPADIVVTLGGCVGATWNFAFRSFHICTGLACDTYYSNYRGREYRRELCLGIALNLLEAYSVENLDHDVTRDTHAFYKCTTAFSTFDQTSPCMYAPPHRRCSHCSCFIRTLFVLYSYLPHET